RRVLRAPIGLEGWALHAELAAADYLASRFPSVPVLRMTLFHRVRRLLSAVVVLRSRDGGRDVLAHVLRRLPDDDARALGATAAAGTWAPAYYAIGLVETQAALHELHAGASTSQDLARLHARGLGMP